MSCYGAATVYDGQVFYGLGNSTFSEHRDPAAGYVLCRDAKTGKAIWDCQLPDTVIARPAEQDLCLFGCYDGYCSHPSPDNPAGKAGTIAWKTSIGRGPIVAGIATAGLPDARISDVIYVAGKQGVLAALDPYSGGLLWNISIQAKTDMPNVDLDATPVVVTEDDFPHVSRRIYIGVGIARGETALPSATLLF